MFDLKKTASDNQDLKESCHGKTKCYKFYDLHEAFFSSLFENILPTFSLLYVPMVKGLVTALLYKLGNEIYEPRHKMSNTVVCATSKSSDQPAHTHSLIRAFACNIGV